MKERYGRAIPSRPIPKRPSQLPQEPPSPPKRSTFLPVSQSYEQPPPLAESRIEALDDGLATTQPPEEPPSFPVPAAVPSEEVAHRSLLTKIATVKSEALRPTAPLDRKNGGSSYPALVHRTAARPKTAVSANAHLQEQGMVSPYPALVRSRRSKK